MLELYVYLSKSEFRHFVRAAGHVRISSSISKICEFISLCDRRAVFEPFYNGHTSDPHHIFSNTHNARADNDRTDHGRIPVVGHSSNGGLATVCGCAKVRYDECLNTVLLMELGKMNKLVKKIKGTRLAAQLLKIMSVASCLFIFVTMLFEMVFIDDHRKIPKGGFNCGNRQISSSCERDS